MIHKSKIIEVNTSPTKIFRVVKTNAREDEEMAMLDKRTVKVRNGQIRETEGFMFTHCYDFTPPNLSQFGAKQA